MYEARQNKEKVSRRIEKGGMAKQKKIDIEYFPKIQTFKTSAPLQMFNIWNYLTGNLTEDEKDNYYFRRASFNPLNYLAQRDNVAYENKYEAYHTTSVHGAQNSLDNIRARHEAVPIAFMNGMSNMENTLLAGNPIGLISQQNISSRFASASWERHARIDAINAFKDAAAEHGFNVNWIPNALNYRRRNVRSVTFTITYSNPILGNYEVGVVSNVAGPMGLAATQPTNMVKVVINYQQNVRGNFDACIGQMFPVLNSANNHNGIVQVNNFHGTAWHLTDFK